MIILTTYEEYKGPIHYPFQMHKVTVMKTDLAVFGTNRSLDVG